MVMESHRSLISGLGKNGLPPKHDTSLNSEVNVNTERSKTILMVCVAFAHVCEHIKLEYKQEGLSLNLALIWTSGSVWVLIYSITFLMKNWPASDGEKVKFWTNSTISKQEKRMHRFLILSIIAIAFKTLPSAVAIGLAIFVGADQTLIQDPELDVVLHKFIDLGPWASSEERIRRWRLNNWAALNVKGPHNVAPNDFYPAPDHNHMFTGYFSLVTSVWLGWWVYVLAH